jgi:hypothetical protein
MATGDVPPLKGNILQSSYIVQIDNHAFATQKPLLLQSKTAQRKIKFK